MYLEAAWRHSGLANIPRFDCRFKWSIGLNALNIADKMFTSANRRITYNEYINIELFNVPLCCPQIPI